MQLDTHSSHDLSQDVKDRLEVTQVLSSELWKRIDNKVNQMKEV